MDWLNNPHNLLEVFFIFILVFAILTLGTAVTNPKHYNPPKGNEESRRISNEALERYNQAVQLHNRGEISQDEVHQAWVNYDAIARSILYHEEKE